MANKIDSESTAAVTDPSSGVDSSADSSSVAGSQEKDGKMTPIEGNVHKPEKSKGVDSSADSSSVAGSQEKDVKTTPIEGNIHKPEKRKGVDSSADSSSVAGSQEKDGKTTPIEGNVHKPEKNKGVDSSGDSLSDAGSQEKDESLVNSQRPKSGGGFKHEDEANAETGENKDKVQDAEPKKEPESGENKDQVPNAEPKKEPESGENKDQVPNAEPKKEPESGENKDQVQDTEAKQELESSWKGDSLDGTRRRHIRHASETESLQHPISTELPQNRQSQITVGSNYKVLWISTAAAAVFFLVLVLCKCNSDSTPPVPKELNVVDVFNQEMEKLKTNFPNQRPELWRRSQIHLRRHLKTEHPTEPVSLILTSGHKAERTLGCLAQCLAQAFSTALNSSVLRIDGKSKASQDSDQVKLDIDSDLKNAFEGKKIAAVIHRFEELPPGSTLIFYRYCDHENAAYKNVFLAFTVMLDAEVEVPTNVSLGRVEEMVQEHVKQKFVSSDKLANFNQMDVDKLSGLWSRISHLILPVSAEEKIERQGCEDCKSF